MAVSEPRAVERISHKRLEALSDYAQERIRNDLRQFAPTTQILLLKVPNVCEFLLNHPEEQTVHMKARILTIEHALYKSDNSQEFESEEARSIAELFAAVVETEALCQFGDFLPLACNLMSADFLVNMRNPPNPAWLKEHIHILMGRLKNESRAYQKYKLLWSGEEYRAFDKRWVKYHLALNDAAGKLNEDEGAMLDIFEWYAGHDHQNGIRNDIRDGSVDFVKYKLYLNIFRISKLVVDDSTRILLQKVNKFYLKRWFGDWDKCRRTPSFWLTNFDQMRVDCGMLGQLDSSDVAEAAVVAVDSISAAQIDRSLEDEVSAATLPGRSLEKSKKIEGDLRQMLLALKLQDPDEVPPVPPSYTLICREIINRARRKDWSFDQLSYLKGTLD